MGAVRSVVHPEDVDAPVGVDVGVSGLEVGRRAGRTRRTSGPATIGVSASRLLKYPANALAQSQDGFLGSAARHREQTGKVSGRAHREIRRAVRKRNTRLNASANPGETSQVPQPLIDNPTFCTGEALPTELIVRSYQHPKEAPARAVSEYAPIDGCEAESFNPVSQREPDNVGDGLGVGTQPRLQSPPEPRTERRPPRSCDRRR